MRPSYLLRRFDMKKILIYTLLLFWWCLLFPIDSCFDTLGNADISSNSSAIMIHGKEIRFGLWNLLSSDSDNP